MIIRPRSRRSLLAATVAALPFGAQAALYLPSFNCNSETNVLESIAWDTGPSLSTGIGLQVDSAVESKPFSCDNKLYSAGTLSGDSFSINFGELKLSSDIEYKFEISSVAHKVYLDTFDGKIEATVSDFNLFVGAYKLDEENKLVLENKFFIGVEILALEGSALSADNKFYVDDSGNLIFDPPIPGGEAVVSLLAAPVPEPPALPLIATGLAGIAALLRRRKEPR